MDSMIRDARKEVCAVEFILQTILLVNKPVIANSNFAIGTAIWRTWQNITCLWFWLIGPIMWKHIVIHKTGFTWHIALSPEDNRATTTTTGNMYRKLKVSCNLACDFRDMRADKQTDRQTQAYRYTDLDTLPTCWGRSKNIPRYRTWKSEPFYRLSLWYNFSVL